MSQAEINVAGTAGIPGATNVDHIAWTVKDLAAAVRFFVDVLGGAEIFRAGPFADPEGDWMAVHLDVDPKASADIVMIRLGSNQVVELLEYQTPGEVPGWPANNNPGGSHIAIHVTDMVAAVEYLVGKGCEPCGEPTILEDVPHAGLSILYLRTPIDLYLELVMRPNNPFPFESATDIRLLEPAPQWTNF